MIVPKFEINQQYKIVFLGDSSVGKTSILQRLIKNHFNIMEQSTVNVNFESKVIMVKDHPIQLNIWDTCGQEVYRSILNMYYKSAHAAILVYDITNPGSFEVLEFWMKELHERCDNQKIIKVIVANKQDLIQEERVSFQSSKEFAKANDCELRYTSAKDGFGISDLFQKLAEDLYGLGPPIAKDTKSDPKPHLKPYQKGRCCRG